jgi:hypothetical protein
MRMIIGIMALVVAGVVSTSRDLWALSFENVATVVQVNFCQDCEGVQQQNLAVISQGISSNNLFMYIPALTTADMTSMNTIANTAHTIQQNFCLECTGVDQQNIVLVIQEVDINDPIMGFHCHKILERWQNGITNITDVTQTNECIICENVDQSNLLVILQNISPEGLFISTPEGITQSTLFTDLINGALNILREIFGPFLELEGRAPSMSQTR